MYIVLGTHIQVQGWSPRDKNVHPDIRELEY